MQASTHQNANMRTTLDLADGLFRRLKARAAMEGISLKDLLGRYAAAGLARDEGGGDGAGQVAEAVVAPAFVSAFDVMHDGAGLVKSEPPDLATNPAYMEGFGRD
jgi:hypothetical protein